MLSFVIIYEKVNEFIKNEMIIVVIYIKNDKIQEL